MIASNDHWWVCCALIVLSWPQAARSADEPSSDGRRDERTERLMEMRRRAEEIKLERTVGQRHEQVDLVERPVLRFADVPRGCQDATVWVWGRQGRPAALMSLELYPNTPDWGYGLTSLCDGPIVADCGRGTRWATTKPGFQPLTFPEAPEPADTAPKRLRQIKELSHRFAAHEFWDPDNQRSELRLLTQPVHQYDDAQAGILDGALFIISHGTNPEIVLAIEAVRDNDRSFATWRYALMRLSHAELRVRLDDREVWRQPRLEGRFFDKPYCAYSLPLSK